MVCSQPLLCFTVNLLSLVILVIMDNIIVVFSRLSAARD